MKLIATLQWDEQIMYPTTIIDQPVPLLGGSTTQATGTNSDPVISDSGAATPRIQIDQVFPPVLVAQETISESLNTETKTILAQYTFESLGAISIGTYVNGTSGNILISPNGIVATNVNGVTTFSLDGTTGNATFLGSILAGAVITGSVNVGNNNVIIDGANRNIIINDGSYDRVLIGYQSGGF